MRKSRLIILPTKCLKQIGFLLLFLSCPVLGDIGRIRPESEESHNAIRIAREGSCGLQRDPKGRLLEIIEEGGSNSCRLGASETGETNNPPEGPIIEQFKLMRQNPSRRVLQRRLSERRSDRGMMQRTNARRTVGENTARREINRFNEPNQNRRTESRRLLFARSRSLERSSMERSTRRRDSRSVSRLDNRIRTDSVDRSSMERTKKNERRLSSARRTSERENNVRQEKSLLSRERNLQRESETTSKQLLSRSVERETRRENDQESFRRLSRRSSRNEGRMSPERRNNERSSSMKSGNRQRTKESRNSDSNERRMNVNHQRDENDIRRNNRVVDQSRRVLNSRLSQQRVEKSFRNLERRDTFRTEKMIRSVNDENVTTMRKNLERRVVNAKVGRFEREAPALEKPIGRISKQTSKLIELNQDWAASKNVSEPEKFLFSEYLKILPWKEYNGSKVKEWTTNCVIGAVAYYLTTRQAKTA